MAGQVNRRDCVDRIGENTDYTNDVCLCVLDRTYKQPAPEGIPNRLTDPLVADIVNRVIFGDVCDWFNPIVVDEAHRWLIVRDHHAQQSRPGLTDAPTSTSSHLRRSRGRPKKSNPPSVCTPKPSPVSKGFFEAQLSWETAKMLGISSSDQTAVIAGIRKSKRILIMEEKEK